MRIVIRMIIRIRIRIKKDYIKDSNPEDNKGYWRLGGESNREVVSFRSCVRAGEARRSCEGERETMCCV